MALYRFALIACLSLMAACTQSEGEACQVNSDCEDGLTCLVSGPRGTCVSGPMEDAGTTDIADATVSPEASVRDGATDSTDAAADDDAG